MGDLLCKSTAQSIFWAHQCRPRTPSPGSYLTRRLREHRLTYWLGHATILFGWSMAKQGHNENAIAQIRGGLTALRQTGAETRTPYFLCLLAEACREAGRLNDGLIALTEALITIDKREIRSYKAEAYRLKGELLLKKDLSDFAEAQHCFYRAIETARKQGAQSFELRATSSIARLLRAADRSDEAREMLAEIYSWFSEDFDTADLKEAKALLDELSR